MQIDDGWQGDGTKAGQRDWTTINQQRVPDGMADLAAHIKSLGLTPGLWIAPHGQNNPKVVADNPGLFLLKPDGASASDTWEGKFLLDPTHRAARPTVQALFSKLTGWGYEYFKIDGQPIVVDEYRTKKEFMKNAVRRLRRTLPEHARHHPEGHRAKPLPARLLGHSASRAPASITARAPAATSCSAGAASRWRCSHAATIYYLHNIVWYADPDVLLVRSPLTLDQARVWATFQGLTGQALHVQRPADGLAAERVELLQRVYPAVDTRPLDLFPCERNKTIWDLKINHLDRNYDVVGVFNSTKGKSSRTYLNWKDLGLPGDQRSMCMTSGARNTSAPGPGA